MDELRNAEIETAAWTQMDESELAEESGKSSDEISEKILHLLRGYWRRRKLALGIVAAGMVLSIAFSLMLPNVYTSLTSLMPQDNASPYSEMLGMLSGAGTSASLGSDLLGLSTPGELLTSILESRTVQYALVDHYALMNHYKVHIAEDARTALRSATNIDQDRKSGIITISVTDKSPDFACKLAGGYVAELNHVLTENSTSAARRERIFLEGRLKDVKSDLDTSSLALSRFSTKNKAIDLPGQGKSLIEASLRIQGLLAESQSQLAALKQTYSEDNNRVKAMEARNAELQRQFNALGGVSKASASSTNAENPYPSIGDLPALGLTYYELERKVRVDEALWEALTKQYEMARVQEAKEIPTIRVLDVANVPNRKAGPKRSMIVLTVTFLSFLLSCLVVFVLGYWEEMDNELEPKKFLMRNFGRALKLER